MNHTQEPVTNWLECITRLPAGIWGKTLAIQWAAEAKAANQGVGQVLRYVNDGLQQVHSGDTEATREARARDWFGRFIDGTFLDGQTAGIPHWQAVGAVSWWNEYYADSQSPQEKELWWRQERTAARIWRDEYRQGPNANKLADIRLLTCATAVGNNIPWQSAETAVLYDAILDYHPYTHWTRPNGIPTRDPGDWRWLSGRWAFMDDEFRERGFEPDWFFGECGPFESAVTGWKSPACLNNSVPDYVNAVRLWLRDVKGTHAWQTGRVLGFALFTTAGGNHWPGFQTRQPELNTLAEMVAEEWIPVTPPPEPPPNEWADGVDVSHHQGVMNWEVTADRVRFAFIRASNGTAVDTRFATNWPAAKAAGLLYRGAYHFYRNLANPLTQAGNFVNVVGSDRGELPLVVDCEDTEGTVDPVRVRECLLEVERLTGRKPAIYTAAWWWNQHIGNVDWASEYELWVANWRTNPPPILPSAWDDWQFWQWSSEGNGRDYGASSTYIDLNYFHGSEAELDDYVAPPPSPHSWNKTVVLLPQQIPEETYLALCAEIGYPTRTEVAFSADSAFAPQMAVNQHKVIVYDVAAWGGREALEEWVQTMYGELPEIEYRVL